MEKTDERRSEQRLRYRWPVRFAADPRQKPLAGQMFDLSSTGMSMLFHANEDCPQTNESITANFGVPHFDAHGSFDTAFFNRVGRVCRVDHLTSRVNRIAVRFAEPLFFRPGEQDINESEAQQRLNAKARLVAGAPKQETHASKTLAGEKEQARFRQESDRRARAGAEKIAVAEALVLESARKFEQEIAKVKADAAREIARLEDETEYKIAEAKAEVRAKLLSQAKSRERDQGRHKKKDDKTAKSSLAKKLDEFITDRGQIY